MKTLINEDSLGLIGFKKILNLIQDSYIYVLTDSSEMDSTLKTPMFHYKALSLAWCNDLGKKEYYVFIREGTTNKRHEDDVITLSKSYQYIEQVQDLINALTIKVE